MKTKLILFVFFLSSLTHAKSFVDPSYFHGCTPEMGKVSCDGKIYIAYGGGYGLEYFPQNISGYPDGTGDSAPQWQADKLLSLGHSGFITLRMTEAIRNEPGPDIRVFENPFYIGGDKFSAFMEWAYVEVSQDGINFFRFPHSVAHPNTTNPYDVFNLAGVFPVYANINNDPFAPQVLDESGRRIPGRGPGGDDFDLSTLNEPLDWIQYIRIVDAKEGSAQPSGKGSEGFDLDTVVGLH